MHMQIIKAPKRFVYKTINITPFMQFQNSFCMTISHLVKKLTLSI